MDLSFLLMICVDIHKMSYDNLTTFLKLAGHYIHKAHLKYHDHFWDRTPHQNKSNNKFSSCFANVNLGQ
jgi:hypothetical protein